MSTWSTPGIIYGVVLFIKIPQQSWKVILYTYSSSVKREGVQVTKPWRDGWCRGSEKEDQPRRPASTRIQMEEDQFKALKWLEVRGGCSQLTINRRLCWVNIQGCIQKQMVSRSTSINWNQSRFYSVRNKINLLRQPISSSTNLMIMAKTITILTLWRICHNNMIVKMGSNRTLWVGGSRREITEEVKAWRQMVKEGIINMEKLQIISSRQRKALLMHRSQMAKKHFQHKNL